MALREQAWRPAAVAAAQNEIPQFVHRPIIVAAHPANLVDIYAGMKMRTHRLSPRILKLGALAAIVFACSEPTAPRGESAGTPSPVSYAISDAMHADGNRHVFFLPPVVAAPQTTNGRFDPNVAAEVDICELTSAGCLTPFIAQFSRATGSGSEIIRVDGEKYIVNWHTDRFPVSANKTYRIRLRVLGTILGFADVQVFSNSSQAKNAVTGETFALVDGRTLPIKFRIEEGAVFVFPASGGKSTSPDGKVEMEIAAGALSEAKAITVNPTTDEIGDELIVPGAIYDFGPSGTQFATPIKVSMRYDLSAVPPGTLEENIRLHMIETGVDGEPYWAEVKESSVDVINHEVTGLVPHFSKVAGKSQTPVSAIEFDAVTPVVIPAGSVRGVIFYLRDSRGNLLHNRQAAIASTDPGVLTVTAPRYLPAGSFPPGTAYCANGCYTADVTSADVAEGASVALTVTADRATAVFTAQVTPRAVSTIAITPLPDNSQLSMRMYETRRLSVALLGEDGRSITNRQLTWSGGAMAAKLTPADANGYVVDVEALARGELTLVLAIQGSSMTASVPVRVSSPPAARLAITPGDQTVPFGNATFAVKAYDVKDVEIPDAPFTWTIADSWMAQFDPREVPGATVLINATYPDGFTTTVSVTSESATASAQLTVDPDKLERIVLFPETVREHTESTVNAQMTGASGAGLLRPSTWYTENDEIASVSSSTSNNTATVYGNAPGTTTLHVLSEGVEATTTVTVLPLPVERVEIEPSSPRLEVGDVFRLTMIPYFGQRQLLYRTAAWSSENGVVEVDSATGVVTARRMGSANVRAAVTNEDGSSVTGTALIEVVAPPIASMSIEQASPDVFIGEQTSFLIKALDLSGNLIDGLDYDVTPTNGERIDIVNLPGLHTGTGRIGVPLLDVRGVQAGDVTLNVQVPGTNVVAEITFTVKSRVARIVITPSNAEILIGETVPFSATAFDVSGVRLTDPVKLGSGDRSIATVDGKNTVLGIAEGATEIFAAIGEVHASVPIIVVKTLKVATVEVIGPSTRADIEWVQYRAVVKSAGGTVLTDRKVEWKLDNPNMFINQSGLIYGNGWAGNVTVTAMSEDVKGSLAVEVTPSPVLTVTSSLPTVILTSGERNAFEISMKTTGDRFVYGREIIWTSSRSDLVAVGAFDSRYNFVPAVTAASNLAGRSTVVITATIDGQPFAVSEVTVLPTAGRIIVDGDAATLGDEGMSQAPGAATYARNIAAWFSRGTPARFLVCAPSSVSWARLAEEVNASGNLAEFGCGSAMTPENMATTYAGVFVVGKGLSREVLTQYVLAGGNVYVAGGSGEFAIPSEETSFWNAFLFPFGLRLYYNPSSWRGVWALTEPRGTTGPVFTNVGGLFLIESMYGGPNWMFGTYSSKGGYVGKNVMPYVIGLHDGGAPRVAVLRPTSVQIVTPTPSITSAQTAQFSAIVKLGTTVLTGAAVEWNSSDPNIATISANGLVTPRNIGTVTIIGSSNGVSGTAQLEITARWFMSSTEGTPGAVLHVGQFLQSKNGQHWLVMQADCNLVLYRGSPGRYDLPQTPLWGSGTNGRNPFGVACYTTVEQDGNVVIYAGGLFNPSRAVWAAGVRGLGQYHIAVEDDGRWGLWGGATPDVKTAHYFSVPF